MKQQRHFNTYSKALLYHINKWHLHQFLIIQRSIFITQYEQWSINCVHPIITIQYQHPLINVMIIPLTAIITQSTRTEFTKLVV